MKNIEKISEYLSQKVFNEKIKNIRPLNKGGTSANYKVSLKKKNYLLKILSAEFSKRAERLIKIYKALQKNKLSFIPKLCTFKKKSDLHFGENILILMDFVEGKRLTSCNITDDVLRQIVKEYKKFLKADFKNVGFVYPFVGVQEIFENIKENIEKNKQEKGFVKSVFCRKMEHLLEIFGKQLIALKTKPTIIHGDLGPNNFILSKNKIYFLDFEMIRFGYISEDLMHFILSVLLKHSVLFFNKKKFIYYIKLCNQTFHLNFNDWVYGAQVYFLRSLYRRLYTPKILKSPRKSWLCINHFQKYEKIVQLIKTVY